MPNPKAKRQRVLENIQRRNSWYREQFAERGKDVPAGAADNLAEVEKKTADAEQRLDQDDGAYFLDVAQSAQSFFEHNFARSGFFLKAGGTTGSRITDEETGNADQRAQWIRVARENLPPATGRCAWLEIRVGACCSKAMRRKARHNPQGFKKSRNI